MDEEQYQSIYDAFDLSAHYFTWQINNTSVTIPEFVEEYMEDELFGDVNVEKIIALMLNNGITYKESESLIDDGNYLVLTDSEADEEAKESAEYYFEEVVLPEIPEYYQRYMDENAFISDYLANDRGEIIAYYDNIEHEETVNDTTYYIYRR